MYLLQFEDSIHRPLPLHLGFCAWSLLGLLYPVTGQSQECKSRGEIRTHDAPCKTRSAIDQYIGKDISNGGLKYSINLTCAQYKGILIFNFYT